MEKLRGRLGNVAQIRFPGKAFLRRFDAVIYMPSLQYNTKIDISDYIISDLKWWEWVLANPKNVEVPFDYILKSPDDADLTLYTDATTTLGIGGHMGNRGFRVDWKDTNLDLVRKIRGKTHKDEWCTDIACLELLAPAIACKLWAKEMQTKSVTMYIDNASAAAAVKTKAPKLYRIDMNYLIRYMAKLAVSHNFLFWGIHKFDKDMDRADGLSRLKTDDKYQFGPDQIDDSVQATIICNELLTCLMYEPNNLPQDRTIPYKIRKEYNILLDDRYLREEKLAKNKIIYKYNILTRDVH